MQGLLLHELINLYTQYSDFVKLCASANLRTCLRLSKHISLALNSLSSEYIGRISKVYDKFYCLVNI